MSKHTAGPWESFVNSGVVGVVAAEADVAHCRGDHLILDTSRAIAEDVANARLIAAAPELLEALKAWFKNDISTTEWLRIARAAIAKAEGRA